MNEGILTKAYIENIDGKNEIFFNIRLDRNIEDKDKENYNIYVDLKNKKTYLFKCDTKCVLYFDKIIVGLNNKYNFELDFTEYEKNNDNAIIIKAISIK